MEIDIKYLRLESSAHPFMAKVEKTYTESFPEKERRDFDLLKQMIGHEEMFNLYAVIKGEEYVGFLSAWRFEDFCYIEHFAIDEAARNGGVGGKILSAYIKLADKPIVLEVELPTDEITKRRIAFYERFGFLLNDNDYFQPPYRKGGSFLEMKLMSLGMDLDKNFTMVKEKIHKYVYGYAEKTKKPPQ